MKLYSHSSTSHLVWLLLPELSSRTRSDGIMDVTDGRSLDFWILEVYSCPPMRVSLSFLDALFTPPWLRILSAVSTEFFVIWIAACVRSLTVFDSISLTANTVLASIFLFSAVKAETLLERSS